MTMSRHDGGGLLVEALIEAGNIGGAIRAARLARARLRVTAVQADCIDSFSADQRGRWEELHARYQRERETLEALRVAERTLPRSERLKQRGRLAQAEQGMERMLDQLYELVEARDTRPRSLTTPAPGQLFLVFFPLGTEWVALSHSARSMTVKRIGAVDVSGEPSQLAAQLLGPFLSEIEPGMTLRLFPFGSLESVDFHALPWNQAPLAERVAVEYGLDIQSRRSPVDDPRWPGTAVLAADPLSDLPAARSEAMIVRQALRRWTAETLQGNAATRLAVLQSLGRADLLHFAGHGTFGGRGGDCQCPPPGPG